MKAGFLSLVWSGIVVIVLGLVISVGWGLTFVLTKGSVKEVSPLLFVSLRFLLAALVLFPAFLFFPIIPTQQERTAGKFMFFSYFSFCFSCFSFFFVSFHCP